MGPGPADNLVGEVFQIVGAAPGIDDLADLRFVLDVQLVLRANRAEKSVGRAMASSSAFVCRDWV